MNTRTIVIYCGLLLSITAFSVDIMLPAFSLISEGLATPYSAVQVTIPIFLFSTGIGQIVMGPLSDRMGRKPVILVGLGIYCTGALVCFAAPDITLLLAGRAIQGFGAAVGPVLGRAVLRDLFTGRDLAANMALATMLFAFGPIVAPLLGVGIMQFGSWRLIFFVIAAFGIVLLVAGALRLPETIPARNPSSTRYLTLAHNVRSVLGNPQSRFYLLMSGPIMTMMMLILVAVPRVYKESFDIDGPLFAVLFALHGTGIIIGQIVNRWLIPLHGVARTMRLASTWLFTVVIALLLLQLAGLLGPYVLSPMLVLFAMGYLALLSNATAMALDPHGDIAGFVSSFVGFVAQFFSALAGLAIALAVGGDTGAMIVALLVLSGLVMSTLFLHRMRNRTRDSLEL